jgi:hypothetical protein
MAQFMTMEVANPAKPFTILMALTAVLSLWGQSSMQLHPPPQVPWNLAILWLQDIPNTSQKLKEHTIAT